MSKESDRLKALARRVSDKRKDDNKINVFPINAVNPPRGQKGAFVKVTVTLSPDIYQSAVTEVTRRKLAKTGDAQISAVIREALAAYLTKGTDKQASASA
jgi:hypothetical protein